MKLWLVGGIWQDVGAGLPHLTSWAMWRNLLLVLSELAQARRSARLWGWEELPQLLWGAGGCGSHPALISSHTASPFSGHCCLENTHQAVMVLLMGLLLNPAVKCFKLNKSQSSFRDGLLPSQKAWVPQGLKTHGAIPEANELSSPISSSHLAFIVDWIWNNLKANSGPSLLN